MIKNAQQTIRKVQHIMKQLQSTIACDTSLVLNGRLTFENIPPVHIFSPEICHFSG